MGYPGVERAVLVDATQGALSLYISHLEIGPGGRVTTHIHPDSEEAMVIVEGSLEAILGDQVVTLGEGDTVLAPAGVKHGFENRSGATARLLAIFESRWSRIGLCEAAPGGSTLGAYQKPPAVDRQAHHERKETVRPEPVEGRAQD